MHAAIAIFAFAAAGALLGAWLANTPAIAARLVPLSGFILIALALFGILPEASEDSGWPVATAALAGGFALLLLVDRCLFQICPECSHAHSHQHADCAESLHGFAIPLAIAATVHSFLDGWLLVAAQHGSERLQWFLIAGIAIHKGPEGVALGAMLRAAVKTLWVAAVLAVLAEFMTVIGAAIAIPTTQMVAQQWMGVVLGAAAGTFVFLGYHAVEAQLRRWTKTRQA